MKLKYAFILYLMPLVHVNAQLYDYNNAESRLVSYSIEHDLIYGIGAVDHGADTLDLLLDAYIPDTIDAKKAAILVMHAGGFVNGSKQNGGVVAFSEYFASRGFACFSIDYRLGPMKPPVYSSPWRVFARKAAIIDGKKALRWIHANADLYDIDTSNIFMYGASAGGIMSLYIAVSDYDFYLTDAEGDSIPEINNPGISMETRGAMALSGSLYGDSSLITPGDPALMVFHGTEDTIVPFADIPSINTLALQNNVPIDYYPIEGAGHVPSNSIVDGKSFNELAFEFMLKHLQKGPPVLSDDLLTGKSSLYPNPAYDHFQLYIFASSEVRIYAADGKLISVNDLQQGSHTLSAPPGGPGVYFLQLQYIDKTMDVFKLIITGKEPIP